jgi:hypothetical protein
MFHIPMCLQRDKHKKPLNLQELMNVENVDFGFRNKFRNELIIKVLSNLNAFIPQSTFRNPKSNYSSSAEESLAASALTLPFATMTPL